MTIKYTTEAMAKMAPLFNDVDEDRPIGDAVAQAQRELELIADYCEMGTIAATEGFTLDEWVDMKEARENWFGGR